QVGPARAIEPAPMPPVADIKPMVQPPKNRHVGAGGIFSDISDKWTGNLSISSGWFYRHSNGELLFSSGNREGPTLLRGFYVTWGRHVTLDELPEPNAPFGLQIAAVTHADDALKAVRRFENLKALGLSLATISNDGLENLKENRNLEWLLLFSAKSAGGDFSAIGGCKQLVYLHLGSTNVSDASLKEISRLPEIKELILYLTPVSDVGLQDVGKL